MYKTTYIAVLAALITSLLMNGLFYVALKRPTIATVDVVSITSKFIKDEAQKNHSEAEKKEAIKRFSHRLEEALTALSYSSSLVILPREAVIKGGMDYTDKVALMISSGGKS